MRKTLLALLVLLPTFVAKSKPSIDYTLRIDSANLGGWEVEIRLRNLPDTFRLAMAAHPEYDDRYYRYLTDVAIQSPANAAVIERVDSVIWRVVAPGGQSTVRYRIELPEPEGPPRAAWRPFLTASGGLTGGPHAFMYVIGQEAAPARVTLDLPAGWSVATGLESTPDPRVFLAPSIDALMESPIFAGYFHDWEFNVQGVPHRVVYWSAPTATAFDTAAFVSSLERLVHQAVALFGRPPYRQYTFVFQDAAYGGLEHPNSVTLGAESRRLAEDPHAALGETAHEFFHTWNLMRIRPEEYGSVTYRTQAPTAGLWFSEGLTLFYADLLLRRAGLPTSDSTRMAHLERQIARYFSSSGNARFSAESISRVAYNAPPAALGDYSAGVHLVGELIGTMLDLEIRRATGGRRSMDDVMRLMLERYSGRRGFNGRDVERAVEDVCRCDVTPLFDASVRSGGKPIEFDRYLSALGLRAVVKWQPAIWNDEPERDLRIWGWETPGEPGVRLRVTDPQSIWGKAGLHSRDRLVSVNGVKVQSWPQFRALLTQARIGDTLAFVVERGNGPVSATVTVAGFDRPSVQMQSLPNPTREQLALREQWERGQ